MEHRMDMHRRREVEVVIDDPTWPMMAKGHRRQTSSFEEGRVVEMWRRRSHTISLGTKSWPTATICRELYRFLSFSERFLKKDVGLLQPLRVKSAAGIWEFMEVGSRDILWWNL